MRHRIVSGVFLASAVALSGCASSAGLDAGIMSVKIGVAVYCDGITEEARQQVRDRISGGVKVIPCKSPQSGPAASPAPPVEPPIPPGVPR